MGQIDIKVLLKKSDFNICKKAIWKRDWFCGSCKLRVSSCKWQRVLKWTSRQVTRELCLEKLFIAPPRPPPHHPAKSCWLKRWVWILKGRWKAELRLLLDNQERHRISSRHLHQEHLPLPFIQWEQILWQTD